MVTRKNYELKCFSDIFSDDCGELLTDLPEWVRIGIARRIQTGSIIFVSAVCPDYEHDGSNFTYRGLGSGLPFIAMRHLDVMARVVGRLKEGAVQVEYHVLLADLEADLPILVDHMAGGDVVEFIRRCQSSCEALREEAKRRGLLLASCERFSVALPDWNTLYRESVSRIEQEATHNHSVGADLEMTAAKRTPYYRAQVGWKNLSRQQCLEMAIRHTAQYSTFGECVTRRYGERVVAVNHATINLSRVNDQHFRRGRERIPVVQLNINTAPSKLQ